MMTGSVCCLWHGSSLERGDDGDIQGGILASHPVGDQDICWPAVCAREEEAPLSDRAKACCHCSVIKSIPQVVMAANPLSTSTTAHGMVTMHVAVTQASWARASGVKDWHPHSPSDT